MISFRVKHRLILILQILSLCLLTSCNNLILLQHDSCLHKWAKAKSMFWQFSHDTDLTGHWNSTLVSLLSKCMWGDIQEGVHYFTGHCKFLLKQPLLFMERSLGMLLLRTDSALSHQGIFPLLYHTLNTTWRNKLHGDSWWSWTKYLFTKLQIWVCIHLQH